MSKPNSTVDFWKFVPIGELDSCNEWTATRERFGYGRISINGKIWKAHRLAWVICNGPIHDGLHVLHSCDNPPCVNVSHLRLGTDADNGLDKAIRNRASRIQGETHVLSKLTDDAVKYIRASNEKGCDLATRFGVSKSNISKARLGRSWTHI